MNDLVAFLFTRYHYWIVIFLMAAGLYIVLASGNLIKRLAGLSLFQTSIFLLFISLGKVTGGSAPILPSGHHAEDMLFSNPLPHVLILTAIVVGVATLALGLALAVRLHSAYGSVEYDDILAADRRDADGPRPITGGDGA